MWLGREDRAVSPTVGNPGQPGKDSLPRFCFLSLGGRGRGSGCPELPAQRGTRSDLTTM